MSYQLLLVLCLQISILNGAPLMLMPIPWMAQSAQQIVLQKQLMELQALQQLTAQSPVQMTNQQQPLMILLPNQESIPMINTDDHLKLHKENDHKIVQTNLENEDDDLNSIVIDAASETTEKQNPAIFARPQRDQNQAILSHPQRAILLIPNARLSIGGIVSAIPWLPIEINVPDTISWAYNGIASGIGSIISIIGRPFQGTPQGGQVEEVRLKSLLNQIQTRQNIFAPIVMMPIDGPVLPIQV